MSNSRRGAESSSSSSGVERVTVVTKTKKKFRLEAQNGQLLPGLPNDITLHKIAPKLSWRLFPILSSVSRGWKEAIESHQVHDARVHSNSTETLVVLHHRPSKFGEEATAWLFSTRDHSCYQLPPIPFTRFCFPENWGRGCCRWISWGSKIYVVGVVIEEEFNKDFMSHTRVSTGVYVLDLAGQREWKQRANMLEKRRKFACGVVGGRIYVFGGTWDGYLVCGSEVYDPNEDAWSPITPMMSYRFGHQVATAGEKLVVYGGMSYDPLLEVYKQTALELGTKPRKPVHNAAFLEIYRPMVDEWELVDPFDIPTSSTLVFMAQGKLHRITCDGIDVHHIDRNEWTTLHSNSFISIEEWTSVKIRFLKLVSVLVANRELLLFVYFFDMTRVRFDYAFLQSKGFGSQKKEIVWEKVAYPFTLNSDGPFACSVEL